MQHQTTYRQPVLRRFRVAASDLKQYEKVCALKKLDAKNRDIYNDTSVNISLKTYADKDFFDAGESGLKQFKSDFIARNFTCCGMATLGLNKEEAKALSDQQIIDRLSLPTFFGVDADHIIKAISQGPAGMIPMIIGGGTEQEIYVKQSDDPKDFQADLFRNSTDKQIYMRCCVYQLPISDEDGKPIGWFPGPIEAVFKLKKDTNKEEEVWGFDLEYIDTDNPDVIRILQGEKLTDKEIRASYCTENTKAFYAARIELIRTLYNNNINHNSRQQFSLKLQEIDSMKDKMRDDPTNTVLPYLTQQLKTTNETLLSNLTGMAAFLVDCNHSAGLPFQILVSGYGPNDHEQISNFINEYIMPLMDIYAEKIASGDTTVEDLSYNIADLYKAQFGVDFSFNLSVFITCETGGKIFCTSFIDNRASHNCISIGHTDMGKPKKGFQASRIHVNGGVKPNTEVYVYIGERENNNKLATIIIPPAPVQDDLKNQAFDKEITQLATSLNLKKNKEMQEPGNRVITRAKRLKATSPTTLPQLTRDVSSAHRAMKNPTQENKKDLSARADKAKGDASPGWQVFGAALMFLGGALTMSVNFMIVFGICAPYRYSKLIDGGKTLINKGVGIFDTWMPEEEAIE